MSRLPRFTGDRLVSALQRAGFEVARTRGSHVFLSHPDGRRTVVPVHKGEDIGAGLTSKILKDVEMSKDDLNDLLKG
ncbi:MAG: type II toxin-antitoxin system HicA family toxin [Dehalococcoidia bacterium]|nr:type II toxin-antitoxin system HicA family toxin [Dehalococcoidia bacterium]